MGKVFDKPGDLPEEASKRGASFEDGWIRINGDGRVGLTLPLGTIKNHGVRARFTRKITGNAGWAMITLRSKYSLNLKLSNFSCDRKDSNDSVEQLFDVPLSSAISLGDEFTMEFAAVGDRLIARYNDAPARMIDDARYPGGITSISTMEDIRDIEVINLDGLPEAEALKLLGVDVKDEDPERYPRGKWVKLFTELEDLPEDIEVRQTQGMKDGWIQAAESAARLDLPSEVSGNYAIRASFRRRSPARLASYLNVRVAEGRTARYQLFLTEGGIVSLQKLDDGRFIGLKTSPSPQEIKSGDPFTLTLGAVGSGIVASLGTGPAMFHEDATLPSGPGYLHLQDDVRDIEILNLDGIPEAEALKLLGVDMGGDERSEADAPAASTTANVSTGTTPHPIGKWVNVITNPGDLPPHLSSPEGGVKWENGRLVFSKRSAWITRATTKNGGIRFRADRSARFELRIRADDRGHRFYALKEDGDLVKAHRDPSGGGIRHENLASVAPIHSDGVETTWEIAAVGNRIIARCGPLLMGPILDSSYAEGFPAFANLTGTIRDVEVINLDGLPEAEALRILGVDENGRDLPAITSGDLESESASGREASASAITAIPELKELHAQFEKLRAERVDAVFAAELAKLNTGYLGVLDRTIADEKKAGSLDGVLALEAEKTLVQVAGLAKSRPDAGGLASPPPCPIPADEESTPEALKKLRRIYRDSFAKLETQSTANLKSLTDPLGVRLKQLESSLTQQNRIDDATFVRGYRERLESGSADATGRSGIDTKEAAKGAGASATKFPSGDDRKAAEYALDLGGSIQIRADGRILDIVRKEQLPGVPFEVVRVVIGRNGVGDAKVPFVGLVPFAGLGSLEHFDSNGLPVTDPDVEILASLPSLVRLHVMTSDSFSGEKLRTLASLEKLQKLNLSYSKLSSEGFAQVAQLPHLTELFATQCDLNDEEVQRLKSLRSLDVLGLARNPLTLAGWTQLSGLKLKQIQYNPESGESEHWAKELAKAFPELTHIQLVIDANPVPQDFVALSAFSRMIELSLSCRLGGGAMTEAIATLGDLEILHLQPAFPIEMSRGSFEALLDLKKLHTLTVQNVDDFSADDLMALSGHRSLRRLNLKSCPSLSDSDIAAFKAERPDVTVALQ